MPSDNGQWALCEAIGLSFSHTSGGYTTRLRAGYSLQKMTGLGKPYASSITGW